MSSLPPVRVMGYVPGGLSDTAAVDTVGGSSKSPGSSPLTKPLYVMVSGGFGSPYARDLSSAVAVRFFLATSNERSIFGAAL